MNIYIILLMFLFLNLVIIMILLLNWLVSLNFKFFEKNSPFECGFEPFESSRLPFSIQFYLIAVLFLIFDIEIVLLLPMIMSLKIVNYYVWLYSSLMVMIMLYLGLEFEKSEGTLNWFV